MNEVQEKVQLSEARKAKYPTMLTLLQHLRMNKFISDKELHPMLDKSLSEAKYYGNEAVVMFKRILFHIGDVSRQHNLLKAAGITSTKGGAGERANFRSVMRWWEKNLQEDFYSKLEWFAEFSVLENLVYDQVRTDRMKGTLKHEERMEFDTLKIASYFAQLIRKYKNPLIAKHLPKYSSGKYRYSVKNGKPVKRAKQGFTLGKEMRNRYFISVLCKILGWSLKDYKDYRKKQHTPEQIFSSKEILSFSEDVVLKLFDRMTSGQRFRIAHMLVEKDKFGSMLPKEKWGNLGMMYIKWENNQTKVAEKIRNTTNEVDKAKVAKDFKVKATGLQTIDILAKIVEGKDSNDHINNTYQALLEKMDLIGNVFPVIDGSGSMRSSIANGWTGYHNKMPYDLRYGHLQMFDVAAAMAIAFSTRNPNPDYRNSFGWFSANFTVVGTSKYKNTSPNQYVTGAKYIEMDDGSPVISEKYPFLKNLNRIRGANPGYMNSTNIGATIEHFVKLNKAGMHVESLPIALLFITDNEGNTGMSPKQFMDHAATIGWSPLVIFWGLKCNTMEQYKGIPNLLFVGGFSESVLGQVLRGIKTGLIMPETELWSINDDNRYSVIS